MATEEPAFGNLGRNFEEESKFSTAENEVATIDYLLWGLRYPRVFFLIILSTCQKYVVELEADGQKLWALLSAQPHAEPTRRSHLLLPARENFKNNYYYY